MRRGAFSTVPKRMRRGRRRGAVILVLSFWLSIILGMMAYTVAYDRESQPKVATIAGRLEDSGLRFLASVGKEDLETLAAVTDADPGGRTVTVAPGERGGQFRFVS